MVFHITTHALVRYIERILKFDFTDLKIQFALERGKPSYRFNTEDGEFMQWLNRQVNLQSFKDILFDHVFSHVVKEKNLYNCLVHSKNADHILDIEDYRYVFKEKSLITIIPKMKGEING